MAPSAPDSSTSSNLNDESVISVHELNEQLSIDVQEILQDTQDIVASNRLRYATAADHSASEQAVKSNGTFYTIRINLHKLQDGINLQNDTATQNIDNIVVSGSSRSLQSEGSSSCTSNEGFIINNRKRCQSLVIIDDDFPEAGPSKKVKLEAELTDTELIELKCLVCLESSRSKIPTSVPCGHVFCNRCIIRAHQSKPKCPVCKRKFRLEKLRKLYFS